eukprot:CAMPEP_0117682928 /NCGR_PEP_ID=MMETSP0804-20121206/20022_1 /TAXON_ID=1074897 /ORGANISM="Tetraselmis astigmatica, Strain CCMP880" /LENGTH=88 /DNA_ID=CAMNT_0005493275 /DNA_START=622 /DNA_END=888 /DNA_ORIENTATION=+
MKRKADTDTHSSNAFPAVRNADPNCAGPGFKRRGTIQRATTLREAGQQAAAMQAISNNAPSVPCLSTGGLRSIPSPVRSLSPAKSVAA